VSGACVVYRENDSCVHGQRRFVFARRRLLVTTGPHPAVRFQQGTGMGQADSELRMGSLSA
jgi:hypothetical protein